MKGPAMRRLLLLPLFALTTVLFADPPTKQQYIVVLKNGKAAPGAADIHALQGTVDHQLPDRIVVSIPDTAVNALRRHASTKYLQPALLFVQPNASAATAISAPARLQPRPMDVNRWSYGAPRSLTNTTLSETLRKYKRKSRIQRRTPRSARVPIPTRTTGSLA
jgi:hypothetical protein